MSGGDRPPAAPPLARRLASFLYEGVLLFGVLAVTGTLYGVLTQQRHALEGRSGLEATCFVAFGLYFVWFWTHGGQTLAMKTWRVRLVAADGAPVGPWRAMFRYLLSWLWFVPALLATRLLGFSGFTLLAALALGVGGYAALSLLMPPRQFLHDILCGTRLASSRPASDVAAQSER